MRTSKMEVSIKNFKHNIKVIQDYVGNKELMPVIKANAYGTYLNTRIDILNMFNIVAVAILDEAGYLRSIGYEKDIFILNQPAISDLEEIYDINPVIGLSSLEFLHNVKHKLRVHLEIETGMNRTGISIKDLEPLCKIIKDTKLQIEGIYTHFSSADIDLEYTNKQFTIFKEALNISKKYFKFKYIHTSASNGILNLKEDITNLVRVGIIMYGYPSNDNMNIILKPSTKLISKINYIKDIEPNTYISYGKTYKSTKKMTIATIGIGYGDGIRRSLSNKGHVLINNVLCPIVGTICMDSLMVDISKCNAKVGDIVYIWDNKKITLEEIANICNTINYEIICNIGNRVERKYVN